MSVAKEILSDPSATMTFIRAGYQTEDDIENYCKRFPDSCKEEILASLGGEQAIVTAPATTPVVIAQQQAPVSPTVLKGSPLLKKKKSKVPFIIYIVCDLGTAGCILLGQWLFAVIMAIATLVFRFVIQLKDLPGRKFIVICDILGIVLALLAVIVFVVAVINGAGEVAANGSSV